MKKKAPPVNNVGKMKIKNKPENVYSIYLLLSFPSLNSQMPSVTR